MIRADGGFTQLRGNRGCQGAYRVEDAVRDVDRVTGRHQHRHGLAETPPDTQQDGAQQPVLGGRQVPGGLFNPDSLRQDSDAKSFVDGFFGAKKNKPVAAICHAPWLLAEINKLRDKKVTSYPSIKSDLINAGANWIDQEVCVDQGLVTSRSPADLDAFNAKFIEEILEGQHQAH